MSELVADDPAKRTKEDCKACIQETRQEESQVMTTNSTNKSEAVMRARRAKNRGCGRGYYHLIVCEHFYYRYLWRKAQR